MEMHEALANTPAERHPVAIVFCDPTFPSFARPRAPDVVRSHRNAIVARIRRAVTHPCSEKNMPIGTVKWFNAQKGYGFIQPENGSKNVFVHISAVQRSTLGSLREGQRLSYEVERNQQNKTSTVNLKQA